MKGIGIIALLLISFTSYSQKGPEMTFVKKGLQFKNVQQGEKISVVYYFTNTGDADLKITKLKPTCGCTVVNYNEGTIAPGQSDSINAVFDSKDRPGYNAKGINLETNAGPISLVFEAWVHAKEGEPAVVEEEEEDHTGHNH